MVKTISPCEPPPTKGTKYWPYHEYYIGERDEEQRKSGNGENHWTGAESLEWYSGQLLRDTMHGIGEYRGRYRDQNNHVFTYEGNFYNNYRHGYGFTSYPNGKVFSGFYCNNFRWGPGVESYARLCENVGIWRGKQLIRLSWRPETPSVVPDLLSTRDGRDVVAQHRSVLITSTKTLGKTNPALELLKHSGADPMVAGEKWSKLYPKNCTDPQSQLYHKDVFDRAYYKNEIVSLEPYQKSGIKSTNGSQNSMVPSEELFYSWNNSVMITHMMNQCYQHQKQLDKINLDLAQILNGPRSLFKPPAEHETDCRAFLMACYLGHIKTVAKLINEYDINPNLTDLQGNSAIMYATCGNQPNVIHFLVEAGAEINDYNDSCCTPLGVALINYACTELNIPPNDIVKAIIPVPSGTTSVTSEKIVTDWKIDRNLALLTNALPKKESEVPSAKAAKSVTGAIGKKKSVLSAGSKILKKIDLVAPGDSKGNVLGQNSETSTVENKLYVSLTNDFSLKVNEIFFTLVKPAPVNYIFAVHNMVAEIEAGAAEEQRKLTDKKDTKKVFSKIKVVGKKSSQATTETGLEERVLLDSKTKLKIEQMEILMATITRLLKDGADPCCVRCPQPALFTAAVAQAPDLLRLLVMYGANVNEIYPHAFNYSPLDIAISQPMSYNSLEVVRTLLEIGAKPDHRLAMNDPNKDPNEPGPTLLHAVLAKQFETGFNEEVRNKLLELLLEFGCDPIGQYEGRSALDIAMMKGVDVFDIFINSRHNDLNAIINETNQSVLLKMFTFPYCKLIEVGDRLQMLTNLILFGADPLKKCQNAEKVFDNLFVYAKGILSELDPVNKLSQPTPAKPKTGAAAASKIATAGKMGGDDKGDYKQALNLVQDCARLLIIRWIQANLMKELIVVVDRFKHRHWNIILKEYKKPKPLGLWLNPTRCLEIWDVFKSTKKRIYNDRRLIRHVLCIVLYYIKKQTRMLRSAVLTSEEKALIESEVTSIMRESNLVTSSRPVLNRRYVTPELTHDNDVNKFQVCFECALPLDEDKITCYVCKLIAFCSLECMEVNVQRYNCHPCSPYIKKKYFPNFQPEPVISENNHDL